MSGRYRPRRTRVYNANYDIGQSYYKSALDNLDRKYSSTTASSLGSTDVSASRASPHIRFNIEDELQDDLQSARTRAARAIAEDSVLDSRSSRMMKSALSSTSAYADDLDEDVQASLTRIRANRKNIAALTNDLDLEDTFSKVKRRSNLDFGDKLLDVAGEDDIGTTIRARALKIVSRTEAEPVVTSTTKSILSSFKSTAISDSSESMSTSAASMRAKATKARLADIEFDINDRSSKLLERERRAANIKKLLAENDIEEVKPSRKMIAF